MARYANPRFYVGPKTNELILGIGRAFNTQLVDPKPDVTITFKRRKCHVTDEITFTSYAVTPEGNAHFEIPDIFRTDVTTWLRGFYDGAVKIGDCDIGDVELVKAPGHYTSFGQSVQERCKGGTQWIEPQCDDPTVRCSCACGGDPTSNCNCSHQVKDNCPTCFNEEFVSRLDSLQGWAEPVASLFDGTDLFTVVQYVGDSRVVEGGDLQWTVTVTNNGPNPASAVTTTVILPPNVVPTANNGTPSIGNYSASSGIWNIGNLAVGANAVLFLEATTQPGSGNSTVNVTSAAATSGTPDSGATPDVLTDGQFVTPLVDLVTFKSVELAGVSSAAANVPGGGTFKFVLDVQNIGGDVAQNVSLVDPINHPLWASITYSASMGAFNQVTNEWVIGNMPAGATAKLEAEITVIANPPIGFTVTNTTSRAIAPGQIDSSNAGDRLSASVTFI